jgi:Zn-dependent protease/predicted transcriptional regulator
VAAGVLFFFSLLLHELAHSLVARHYGIPVPRITLFLFGGMAEIGDEPRTPKIEFFIAIVGPATSLILGLVFSGFGTATAGPGFAELLGRDQDAALAGLSPTATLLFWLGPVNILLGLFNLIPGFPLDGGRVLRAAMWWITGDLYRATRLAADAGRLFGWFFMALGVIQALSGAFLQGLWLLMIGWFLAGAAAVSYGQMVTRNLLKGRTVRDLMRSHFESTGADVLLDVFVDQHLLQSAQVLWPVLEGGRLIGLVTLEEVKGVPPQERGRVRVREVMRTNLEDWTISPDAPANRAIQLLSTRNAPMAVVEHGKIMGLLAQADAAKWLVLHQAAP